MVAYRTACLLALPLLFSCEGRQRDATGVGAAAIVGGTASTADDDHVVLVLTHVPAKDTAQGMFYENCTGTLLSANVVLTARHCVTATSAGTFTCGEDGSLTSGPGGTLEEDFVPADVHVYVGPKLPGSLDPATFPGTGASFIYERAATVTCDSDVALVVLAEPIADAKIASIRLEGDVPADSSLYVVGWGATATSYIPTARQRRDDVTVVDTGPSATQHQGGQLSAKEFLASESVCFGDSGGPAFDVTSGAVVGVVSRGPNGGNTTTGAGCLGTEHTFMKTASFASLVNEAFSVAGGEPWLEGQPPPGSGEGGAGGGGGSAAGGGDALGGSAADNDESGGCQLLPRAPSGGGQWLPFVGLALGLRQAARRRRCERARSSHNVAR